MPGTENDPQELADTREHEADEMAQRSDELQSEVQDTREDWKRKRADDSVPGAPPAEGDASDKPTTDEDPDDGQAGE